MRNRTFARRFGRSVTAMLGLLLGIGTAQAAETVTYYHTDALGTPVMESNAAGTVTYTREHRPYGEQALGAAKHGPGFTGHVGDADTGLTYMQARYFDPASGRFLSNDPVEPDLNSGSNFSRYMYANNNPYKFIDPDGRKPRGNEPEKPDPEEEKPEEERPPQETPQEIANRIAAKITEQGDFDDGAWGKSQADQIYQNNSDKNLSVTIDASNLYLVLYKPFSYDSRLKANIAEAAVGGSDFLVHGDVVVKRRDDGTHGIYDQRYHYEMRPNSSPRNMLRNAATEVGMPPKGPGNVPFWIRYRGNANVIK